MKKFILNLALVLCASTGFAQNTLYQTKLEKKVVPAVVLESVSTDFPEGVVAEYAAIPVEIIEDRVYTRTNEHASDEDYSTYVVILTGKSGNIHATYNRDGELLNTSESLKNVPLPHPIQVSVARHFPGWNTGADKMLMTSIAGGKQKTHYKVKLYKGKETHHVVFDADGNIIRGAKKAKAHRQIKFLENEIDKGES